MTLRVVFFPSLALLNFVKTLMWSVSIDSLGAAVGKFITATFLILGWAFYEMSGGADFVPEERVVAKAEVVVEEPVVETAAVTRSVSTPLVSLTLPVKSPQATAEDTAQVIQASVETVVEAVETANLTETVEAPAAPEPVAAPVLDLRYVAGSRVNMRTGPGTNFGVIDTLPGGTEAEIISVDANGWANIRITNTGVEGWMAERLLTDG